MRESALSSPITVSNLIVTICVLIISLLLVPYKVFAMGITKRVSVSSTGTQANDGSFFPSISSDGRYVAFRSLADNLVDTKGSYDIFVHDLQTAQTSRVSISSTGVPVNGSSNIPSISSDGRYIAFQSWATNLVVGDTNDSEDIFVHDRQTGQTTRASVSSTGEQGNMDSIYASISANGRYVAFNSYANNIVDGDTNLTPDFFVHDRQTGQTTRVSVPSTGAQGQGGLKSARGIPSISSDGRYVAFESYANNLVDGDTNENKYKIVHEHQCDQTTQ
jgi:Tol biopolymer transport system component